MILRLIILNCILFVYAVVFAQAPRFESYKILKNVSSVQVNAIEQDNKGFIWLGTNRGLVKYDGIIFTNYTQADSLYNNNISSLTFNEYTNTLWIGHKDGKISTMHDNIIDKFNPEEGLSSREISSLFFDSNEVLWFSTLNEGIYYFSGENRKRLYSLNADDGLLDNYVYEIAQYNDSIYLFATDKGISVFNFNSKKFVDAITSVDGLPDNLVKDIVVKDSTVWIGMNDGGICKYDFEHRTFSHISDWDFGALNKFAINSKGEIYVSTDKKGIIKIVYDKNDNAWYSNYRTNHGLSDLRTRTVLFDTEENLWIGSRKGLSILKNNHIEFFDINSSFNLQQIFSITKDKFDRFWVASQDGLYIHYHDNMGKITTQKVIDKQKYSNALFICVFCDYQGNIWAGTYGYGIFKINPDNFEYEVINRSNELNSNDIFNITGDTVNLWISTASGGVSKYSFADKTIQNYTMQEGLGSDYVFSVFIEKANKAWVSTDGGGVAIIENDSIKKFKNAFIDSLTTTIYGITSDQDNNLWFNLAEKGIVRINKNKELMHLNEINGLSSNNIQSIMCNNQNQMVATSSAAIDIINANTFQVLMHGEESGYSGMQPNLNAIFKDNNENIYLGTSKGMVKIKKAIQDSLDIPKLHITSKRLFLNEIPADKTKFSYNENNLTFGFTGLWYKAEKPLTYRYKLKGYDLEWSHESTIRMATYPKLPNGLYKFIVQVKMPDGRWIGSDQAVFSFKIKPPFWKTPLFIVISILIGILSIYSYINYRTNKLKRDKEILENEVVKRTAEIRQQKEEIEAQRDEIEAQRNHVMEQHQKIQIQHKDIQASITYASRIQRAVLPPMENFDKLLPDYFVFFKPRDIVSGDFYYLNSAHNKVIIAAADCTGHGVPGAFMSLLGVSLLNQIVSQLSVDFKASDLLNELRAEIKKALRQDKSDGSTKDGMDISLCVIDFENKQLNFSGAFNPLLIIRDTEAIEYKGDKMPIGVFMKDDIEFKNTDLELHNQDMLYMYSDGFQDQFGGEKNRKFLPKKLRALLQDNSNKPMLEQHKILDKTLTNWKGDLHQIDDILVIGVRIS